MDKILKIKKIRPLSLAKTLAIIFLITGFFTSAISSIRTIDLGKPITILNYFLIVIILTFGYLISGFLSGFISAFVFNIVCKVTGGVVIETVTDIES